MSNLLAAFFESLFMVGLWAYRRKPRKKTKKKQKDERSIWHEPIW